MTEGLREVGAEEEDVEEKEEDDFLDEYGNIKPLGLRTNKRKVNELLTLTPLKPTYSLHIYIYNRLN